MATNTKIVLMDLADSWSPHTIDKLNYNFQSILASLNNKRGTSSGGSGITIADVDAEINSLVGDGAITLTQGGTFKGYFSVNQQGDKTIDLDAGGGGGGGGIAFTTKVLKGDGNGNAVEVQSGDLPNAVVNTADPDGAILILNNGSAS